VERGKRLFKMTPLHHHFESWVGRDAGDDALLIVGMMCGLIGVALALL
jgi:UDP-N-acetylmuramyl pentapeptide phosphotransferase/UDP-N-acetylglucosamine-1-phosphate transferase